MSFRDNPLPSEPIETIKARQHNLHVAVLLLEQSIKRAQKAGVSLPNMHRAVDVLKRSESNAAKAVGLLEDAQR